MNKKLFAYFILVVLVFFNSCRSGNINECNTINTTKQDIRSLKNTNQSPHKSESNIDKSLLTIRMIDENNGWALSNNKVYKTTDGGTQWENVTPINNGENTIDSCFFLDEKCSWTFCSKSNELDYSPFVFVTEDGGQKWNKYNIIKHYPITNVHSPFFTDKNNGWIVCDGNWSLGHHPFDILSTKDGGKIWNKAFSVNNDSKTMPSDIIINDLKFTNQKSGWITGSTNLGFPAIYKTVDSGISWHPLHIPFFENTCIESDLPQNSNVVCQTMLLNDKDCLLKVKYLFPGKTAYSKLYSSKDSGKTWTNSGRFQDEELENNNINSFVSLSTGWIFSNGKLYKTNNGGLTWVSNNKQPYKNIIFIQFINENIGWIVDDEGKLYKSVDSGNSWKVISILM